MLLAMLCIELSVVPDAVVISFIWDVGIYTDSAINMSVSSCTDCSEFIQHNETL